VAQTSDIVDYCTCVLQVTSCLTLLTTAKVA